MIIRSKTYLHSRFPCQIFATSKYRSFMIIMIVFLIAASSQMLSAQKIEFILLPEKPAKAFHIKDSPVYLDLTSIESLYTQKSNDLFEGNTFDSHIQFSHTKDALDLELNETIQQFKMMKNTSMEMMPLQDREASGTLIHIIHGEDPRHRQVTWIAAIGWQGGTFQLEGTYPLHVHPQMGKKFLTIFQSIYLERN